MTDKPYRSTLHSHSLGCTMVASKARPFNRRRLRSFTARRFAAGHTDRTTKPKPTRYTGTGGGPVRIWASR